MKKKLAQLPLSQKVLLATPAALLMILLILSTPLIGVPLAATLLAVFRPELLRPEWWREQLRDGE